MVVTFGEMMLRLTPPGGDRLLQTKSFDACFGGAEANVAVSLSCLGEKAKYVTRLPDNDIGRACIGEISRWGVDSSDIKIASGRMGIYYYETGASLRPTKVTYDRAGSAFALSKENDFDWDKIFQGEHWFHYTGITPALAEGMPKITAAALHKAKEKGVFTSCDLNFRSKLWTAEQAGRVMKELLKDTDMLIANEEHAKIVLGVSGETGLAELAKKLSQQFGFQKVAVTCRETITSTVNNFSAVYYDGSCAYSSKKYTIEMVERIGGGDAFAAGLIYSVINRVYGQKAVDFAAAALCLKHTAKGDFNIATAEEVLAVMEGHSFGRVSR